MAEFFVDGKIKKSVTEEPFSVRWEGIDPGKCDLKIRVHNSYGGFSQEFVTINRLGQ